MQNSSISIISDSEIITAWFIDGEGVSVEQNKFGGRRLALDDTMKSCWLIKMGKDFLEEEMNSMVSGDYIFSKSEILSPQ